eukprot:3307722-Pyramimonas_sp.AAC.1
MEKAAGITTPILAIHRKTTWPGSTQCAHGLALLRSSLPDSQHPCMGPRPGSSERAEMAHCLATSTARTIQGSLEEPLGGHSEPEPDRSSHRKTTLSPEG